MNNFKKIFIVYPLMLLLIIGGIFALDTDFSYAAESFDVSHGTKWVQGEDIDSGLRIRTSDGEIAYCLNQGAASPSGSYSDKLNLSSKLEAVLYYGYPNNRKFGATTLTADQARCATQLAVWAYDNSGKGKKIPLANLHGAYDKAPEGDDVLKAAKWLYNKADSGYSAPAKPTFASPTVTKPSNNTPQYFNSSYVRVGPYRFRTTDNSYTSNNKVTVNLSGSPTGTRLGDINGSFINIPSAGTDFYAYIPSADLRQKGTGTFGLGLSYDFEYEKEATFAAYEKEGFQNVAISAKREYTTGSRKTDVTGDFGWTAGKLTKADSKESTKVIGDTEFDIYYDPTPADTANNDWILMYKKITDTNGVINIPGLGVGTYKLLETKPNPNYAFNSESGGSDEIIFQVTDVSTDSIQVMTNNLINVSCEVDKDTIRQTSAAYKSLPDQEGFDNTQNETYRYHVDYRSTADVWADEFVVEDRLEGVNAEQIRVVELWTPICHGDYDGKMNIWYKTNKTDDETVYSEVSAVSSNPVSPNNPGNESVKKNDGYKLWSEAVSTTQRTNLKVSDLELGEDEYVTALRIEHGRVEKGFTTRNYSYDSLNDDTEEDWIPNEDEQFYTKNSKNAEGLKPLTYLVSCPNPLSPPEVIKNSADAFISRNIHLTDDHKDEVSTEVIDTFKEEPKDEEVKGDTAGKRDGKVLGEFEKGEDEVKGSEAKTGDGFKLGLILCLLVILSCIAVFIILRSNRKKLLSLFLVCLLTGGALLTFSLGSMDSSYAESRTIEDSFKRNGLEYTLVKATKVNPAVSTNIDMNSPKDSRRYEGAGLSKPDESTDSNKTVYIDTTTYDVEYKVNQKIDAEAFDSLGQQKMLPKSIGVKVKGYDGKVTISNKKVTPLYIKKQAQIDRIEVLNDLDIEDISSLPISKTYTVRSDSDVDAMIPKELKRAGVSLKVSDHDSDGIPCKWDATIVYRGLETYLEKYRYDVSATYAGKISSDEKIVRPASVSEQKHYNELNESEAKVRNENLTKEKYLNIKDTVPAKEAMIKEKVTGGNDSKTADVMKFLGFIGTLIILSFVIFLFLTRSKGRKYI